MAYKIGRPIEGVFLNGFEYLSDREDNVLLFETEELAIDYLVGVSSIMTKEEVEELIEDCSIILEREEDEESN